MVLNTMMYCLLFSGPRTKDAFIRNDDKPPCIHCEHYIPSTNDEFSSTFGKCKKFGSKDIHTGKVLYDYATSARDDDARCGIEGQQFKSEQNLCGKKIVHRIRRSGPSVVAIICSFYAYYFLTTY
jgi:hypothetical protein